MFPRKVFQETPHGAIYIDEAGRRVTVATPMAHLRSSDRKGWTPCTDPREYVLHLQKVMALNRLEAEVSSAEETELASLLSKTFTQMWAGAYWSEHTQALHN